MRDRRSHWRTTAAFHGGWSDGTQNDRSDVWISCSYSVECQRGLRAEMCRMQERAANGIHRSGQVDSDVSLDGPVGHGEWNGIEIQP